MIRHAFTIRLRPGALEEYRRRHEAMWPELVAEIERSGIGRICAFAADPLVFYYSEITDAGAWDRLAATEIHHRWGEGVRDLIEDAAGVSELGELYCLDTRAGGA
jgi:L-rhamnose mutarotase